MDLGVLLKSDIDRDSTTFKLSDRTLFNTQYQMNLAYEDNSDGFLQSASLEKPFFALDGKSSYGVSFLEEEKESSYFFEGAKYFTYAEKNSHADIFYGWSTGLKNSTSVRHRVGFKANERSYNSVFLQPGTDNNLIENYVNDNNLIPLDINEIYPYYAVDYIEDSYDTISNYDQIARVEDRYTGLTMGFSVGYVDTSLLDKNERNGEDYWKFSSYVNKLFQVTQKASIKANISLDFESQDSGITNILESHSLQFYYRASNNFTTYLDYVSANTKDLRQGQQVFLDTKTGLRGYPVRYLSGEATQKITIEQRYFFNYELFQMFNFGAAAFFDIGAVSGGTDFEKEQEGIYRSVGIGLRVANNRSSEGTIVHLDLTKPIDKTEENSFQFSVIARKIF